MPRRTVPCLPLSAAVLSLSLFVLTSSPAAAEQGGTIRFVSPWSGALVGEGPVVLAGSLPSGTGQAFFLLNGRPLSSVVREDDAFSATFTPLRGFNEVEVRAGEMTARLSFAVGSKTSGQTPYVFHAPLLEGKCKPCHSASAAKGSLTEAALCYRCHSASAVMYPYTHGPVAAGACLICHDPHGSNITGLARSQPEAMCLACHDQPSTSQHTAGRTKVCTLCHHPHYGMNEKFLRGDY